MDRKSTSTLTGAVLLSFLLSPGLKTPGGARTADENARYSQVGGGSSTRRKSAGSSHRAPTLLKSRKDAVEKTAEEEYGDRLRKLIQTSCARGDDCKHSASEFIIA